MEPEVNLYLLGHIYCKKKIEQKVKVGNVVDYFDDKVIDLSDPTARQEYFSKVQTDPGFFGLMSAVVVRRDFWSSVQGSEVFNGSCWAHVARIFMGINQKIKMKYIPTPFFYARGENDSFLRDGVVNRLGITVEGFHRIAGEIFGENSPEAIQIRRVVRKETSIFAVLHAKLFAKEEGKEKELRELIRKIYRDTPLRRKVVFLLYLFIPRKTIPSLKMVWSLRRMALSFFEPG